MENTEIAKAMVKSVNKSQNDTPNPSPVLNTLVHDLQLEQQLADEEYARDTNRLLSNIKALLQSFTEEQDWKRERFNRIQKAKLCTSRQGKGMSKQGLCRKGKVLDNGNNGEEAKGKMDSKRVYKTLVQPQSSVVVEREVRLDGSTRMSQLSRFGNKNCMGYRQQIRHNLQNVGINQNCSGFLDGNRNIQSVSKDDSLIEQKGQHLGQLLDETHFVGDCIAQQYHQDYISISDEDEDQPNEDRKSEDDSSSCFEVECLGGKRIIPPKKVIPTTKVVIDLDEIEDLPIPAKSSVKKEVPSQKKSLSHTKISKVAHKSKAGVIKGQPMKSLRNSRLEMDREERKVDDIEDRNSQLSHEVLPRDRLNNSSAQEMTQEVHTNNEIGCNSEETKRELRPDPNMLREGLEKFGVPKRVVNSIIKDYIKGGDIKTIIKKKLGVIISSGPPPPILNKKYSDQISREVINNTCKGIHNSGTDCFVIAALQCLFVIPKFVQFFAQPHPEWDADKESFKFSIATRQIIYEYFDPEVKCLNISEFRDLFQDEFAKESMHDSVQFVMTLFEKLEDEHNGEDCNFSNTGYQDADDAIQTYERSHPSIVCKLFTGIFELTKTCLKCEKSKILYEDFKTINVHCFIDDRTKGFREFLKFQEKKNSTKFCCNHCDNIEDCTVTCKIVKFPKYLTLVLQRFDPFKRTKICEYMKYPKKFALEDHQSRSSVKYKNIGVINHMGYSPHFGHYLSFPKINGRRMFCNDSQVEESKGHWNRHKSDYILIYKAGKPKLA